MSDTSDGVTHYPIGFRHATKRIPPMAVIAAAVTVALFARSVATDADVRLITAALAAGLVVPIASLVLPAVEHRVVAYALASLAIVILSFWQGETGVDFVVIYAAALWLGHVVAVWIARLREWRRRLAASSGAPPSGRDLGKRSRLPLLATWFEDWADGELLDPSPERVLDAVRCLDGDRRSLVSVFRGHGRLDVGGDARAGLIVQQADNRHRWPRTAHHLTTANPSADDDADLTPVRLAQNWVAVPGRCVVALDDAEAAVATWLTAGRRDPTLPWAPEREIALARPELLTAQDQPWLTWRNGFATGTLGSPVQLPYGGGAG